MSTYTRSNNPDREGPPNDCLTVADVMSVAEVAELLHVPRSTIADWARRGVLPSVKIASEAMRRERIPPRPLSRLETRQLKKTLRDALSEQR